jgi:hypothetical protein
VSSSRFMELAGSAPCTQDPTTIQFMTSEPTELTGKYRESAHGTSETERIMRTPFCGLVSPRENRSFAVSRLYMPM